MESSENRLVFYEPVTSLLRISAFRVALDLWTHKIQCCNSTSTHGYNDIHFKSLSIESTNAEGTRRTIQHKIIYVTSDNNPNWMPDAEMRKAIKALDLPHQIMEIIANFVVTIIEEIVKWMKQHNERAIFSKCLSAISSREKSGTVSIFELMTKECLFLMVWRPDATIDFEKTAIQLVKNGGLDVFHRFDLMCAYFMEDELREARDTWFKMQKEHDCMYFGADIINSRAVEYWNSIISNETPDYSSTGGWFVYYILSISYFSYNYISLRLAFGRIETQERVSCIEKLIMCQYPESSLNEPWEMTGFVNLVKFMISKCNQSEQFALFSRSYTIPYLILVFSYFEADMENAVKAWLYATNFMDCIEFISHLRSIGSTRTSDNGHIHELLVKLWRCSPLSLKKHIYELPENDDFLHKFCIQPDYLNKGYARDGLRQDGILIEILSDAESDFRKRLWSRYWKDIVDRSRPAGLKAIMGLCLSRNEIEAFESNTLSSDTFRQYFEKLIFNGKWSDLNEYLQMLFGGEKRQLIESKRRILEGISNLSSFAISFSLSDESINALDDFVEAAFEEDANGLVEFKVNMISACINYNLYDANHMTRFLATAERLCDEPTLAKLREKMSQICRSMLFDSASMNFLKERGAIPLLLIWCLGSAEKVEAFHRSVRKRRFERI